MSFSPQFRNGYERFCDTGARVGEVSLVISVVSTSMAGWYELVSFLLDGVLVPFTYVSAPHGFQLGCFERLNEELVKKLEQC